MLYKDKFGNVARLDAIVALLKKNNLTLEMIPSVLAENYKPSDNDEEWHGEESEEAFIANFKKAMKVKSDEIRAVKEKRDMALVQVLLRLNAVRDMREAEQKHIHDVTCMDLPLDWENIFDSDARATGVHCESVSDGLMKSLVELGRVDIEYISSVTDRGYREVIEGLKGAIFQNPEKWDEVFYRGWETAEEYLSGNLMRKWKIAKEADKKYNGYFSDNIKAIEHVLPKGVPAEEIYITLGSPWVPTDVINDFIAYLLDLRYGFSGTCHDETTGTWEILYKWSYDRNFRNESTYGTSRIKALSIIERTLNMKSVEIYDEIPAPNNYYSSYSRKKQGNKPDKIKVVNKAETVAATEKQKAILREFREWVWSDEDRKNRLEEIYQNRYCYIRKRIFNGSFLEFPNMSKSVHLFPYQKNAVARIIFSPNTLLAHEVGAGKTYVMIAAGMELRRMGISKKNMYVVPNNIVGQWKKIFLEMYPDAKVLVVEPKSFTPNKRWDMLENMRKGDYDGIIIAYSCFGLIPLSEKYRVQRLTEEIRELNERYNKGNRSQSLIQRKSRLQKELKKITLEGGGGQDIFGYGIYFDDLGVTRLFVDEAHNFKNVPVDTKANAILGINSTGSRRCEEMMEKVRLVQKSNGGGGVVMATGTPITNSITDAYIMQLYLQSGELSMLNLQSFDSWIGMFAERSTEFEVDVDTNSYRLATRLSKFHNLPELTALLSSIADFHSMNGREGIPESEGCDTVIQRTLEFTDFLNDISQRADNVRNGRVDLTSDNMLKITTDGRKAALDFRLIDEKSRFTYQSKVAQMTMNAAQIYLDTMAEKSTQIIFCDSSTPKAGFNLYDETKRLLIELGIPEDEIEYIHSAHTETQREKIFQRMNRGEIRILIGSTFKLGLGVNVQERLVAIHHLDVPWRPGDMTQREGRILRQGNRNKRVKIFRYITEGSFDAYSWQLLETKARFISDLLSGSLTQRSGSEVENTILTYAEVKALAIGNQLVKKRVETANELAKYLILKKNHVENRMRLEQELSEIPAKREELLAKIENCKTDIDYLTTAKPDDGFDRKEFREILHRAISENEMMHEERAVCSYMGFEIVLPANMTAQRPFVYLRRKGKYLIEMGENEYNYVARIEKFLEDFSDYFDKLKENLSTLDQREVGIKEELAKNVDYTEIIEEYKAKIESIDKELNIEYD